MRAAPVRAGVTGAAFPDLAAVIDGDLPGILWGRPDRVPLAPAQIPAHPMAGGWLPRLGRIMDVMGGEALSARNH